MGIFDRNVKELERFVYSSYYKDLLKNNSKLARSIVHEILIDLDTCDIKLYDNLQEKFKELNLVRKGCTLIWENKIRMSADVVCGSKKLFDYTKGNPGKLMSAYKKIRGNVNWHFLWPKHKTPTINTLRSSVYKDRIDYLLFDLKNYFDGYHTNMSPAYENALTKEWLTEFSSFEELIDIMKLNRFVNKSYDVLDISSGQNTIIKDFPKEKISLTTYLEHLLKMEV